MCIGISIQLMKKLKLNSRSTNHMFTERCKEANRRGKAKDRPIDQLLLVLGYHELAKSSHFSSSTWWSSLPFTKMPVRPAAKTLLTGYTIELFNKIPSHGEIELYNEIPSHGTTEQFINRRNNSTALTSCHTPDSRPSQFWPAFAIAKWIHAKNCSGDWEHRNEQNDCRQQRRCGSNKRR